MRLAEAFDAEVVGRGGPDDELFRLRFPSDPFALLDAHGHVPLPPYITHADDADDAARYQSVFALRPGAVAAPTASLHFDDALLGALRSLESAARSGVLQPTVGETDIFITPGFEFRVVDRLVTNFHLPRSTLLMLVSAFAGHAKVMALYRHAIEQRYRFFSYGDAMLLERRGPGSGVG